MRYFFLLLFIILSSCSTTSHYYTSTDDGIYNNSNSEYSVYDDVVDTQDNRTIQNWDWRLNQWRFRTYDYNSFVFNFNSGPHWYNTYYHNPYWNYNYWYNPHIPYFYNTWNNPYWNNPYWNNPYCHNLYWNNRYVSFTQRNIFYGHRSKNIPNVKSDRTSYEKIPQKDVQQINTIEVQRERTITPYKRSDIQYQQQNRYERNIEINRGQNNQVPNRNIQTPNRSVSPSYQTPVRSVQPSPNRNVSPSYQSPRNVNVPPRYNSPSRSNQVSPMPQRTNQLPSKNSIPQRSSPSYPRKN